MADGPFVLPPLAYEYNVLEPHIDARTMEIHHSKHHQAYVTNLNKALQDNDIEEKELLAVLAKYHSIPAVRNNAGGHFNHLMFWEVIAPRPSDFDEPQGILEKALIDEFGSVEKFKEEFAKAGATRFGSGWAWLVVDDQGKLKIFSTANQDVPILSAVGGMDGCAPILCLDVWEHAYYLNYQNRRPDYIKAFWNVVNWQTVEAFYRKATGK